MGYRLERHSSRITERGSMFYILRSGGDINLIEPPQIGRPHQRGIQDRNFVTVLPPQIGQCQHLGTGRLSYQKRQIHVTGSSG
jgi:hypothetical protein